MNMRTTLLFMAATVAPLCAQQPTTPTTEQQLVILSAPATPAESATPEQRAAVFSALALMPADISDFAAFTNISANAQLLAQNGHFPKGEDELPDKLVALDGIAIASTSATPGTYAFLRQVLNGFRLAGMAMQLRDGWAPSASEAARPIISNTLAQTAENALRVTPAEGETVRIPASYAVLTALPGQEAVIEEFHANVLKTLREDVENQPWQELVEDVNGFSGVCLDLGKLSSMHPAAEDEPLRALQNEMARHKVYVLAKQMGNALVIAVCEDPQDIRLATSPADSVLATDKMKGFDAKLGKGLLWASHNSSELMEACHADDSDAQMAATIAGIFSQLGQMDAANRPTYDNAAAAVSFLGKELARLRSSITHPTDTEVWYDGSLNLRCTGDAQGVSYTPGTLRLSAVADAPTTSVYVESTPMNLGRVLPENKVLLDAALNIMQGVTLSLDGRDKHQATATQATMQAFLPEVEQYLAALGTVGSGLDGQVALVLDAAHGPLPPLMGAQPGTRADMPRLSLYLGVSDRSQLAAGWEALLTTTGSLIGKSGGDPQTVRMLPIVPMQAGAAMSYSIALPFFTQDCVPNLTVDDKGVCFGTSARLNQQLLETDTGSTAFAGSVFSFRPEPLAKSLRSLANALDTPAVEEPATPPATTEIAQAELSMEETCESYEEPESDIEQAASALEAAAKVLEGVYATSTIENGLHTIQVQVRLK